MNVRTVLIIEGLANLLLMLIKLLVGIATNSAAIIGDALHSFSDLANNIIALVAANISDKPADADHHYGHRKFEQLAVFSLAVLLIVVAIEFVLNAIRNYGDVIESSKVGLAVMLGVLVINIVLATWQRYWARRLNSQLIEADANHTLSDVMTTVAVIVGWQFAANGYFWADTLVAIAVAVMIVYLAISLLRRSIPILVDHSPNSPQQITTLIKDLQHVDAVTQVRARASRSSSYADITITVDAELSTKVSHDVTEQIEQILNHELGISDVVVHVEPSK